MKTKSMELNNEFWVKVKKEFLKSTEMTLCRGSKTFNVFWEALSEGECCHGNKLKEKRAPIVNQAKMFLLENPYQNPRALFFPSDVVLFCLKIGDMTPGRYRGVRIEFLNYMIQKTKKV